jgi:hypothetical protein
MTEAEEYLEVLVEPEDPSTIDEGIEFGTSLTPADHLTDYKQQYEIERLELGLANLRSTLQNNTDQHNLRKIYSGLLFLLVVAWIGTVWAFVGFQGLGFVPVLCWKFNLSDAVLIAFITSTTASVLGLFGIAAYWLFGTKKSEPN